MASYYSEQYYGKSNGLLAILIGAACIGGFIYWAETSAVNEPVTKAEEELRKARSGNGLYSVEACERNLADAKKYVNSGQSKRDHDAYEAKKSQGSRTTGDLIWCCLAGFGTLVFGWRAVRGVASPFEVLLAVASGIGTVILAASFGIGMFLVLCVAGALIVMAFKVLGDDCINRARWVRDEYDEGFGVNERRSTSNGPRRRLPVSEAAQAAYLKKRKEAGQA